MPHLTTHELVGLSKGTCENYERHGPPGRLKNSTKRDIIEVVGARLGTGAGRAAVAAVMGAIDSVHVGEEEFAELIRRLESCSCLMMAERPAHGAEASPNTAAASVGLPPGALTAGQVGDCLLVSLAQRLGAEPLDLLMHTAGGAPDDLRDTPPYPGEAQKLALVNARSSESRGYVLDFELYTRAEATELDITKPDLDIRLAASKPIYARGPHPGQRIMFEVVPAGIQASRLCRSLPLLREPKLLSGVPTLVTKFQVQATQVERKPLCE